MHTKMQPTAKPIIFAPMEGITNALYRSLILKHYSAWDYVCTDFLRLPTESFIKPSHIINHIGKDVWNNKLFLYKNIFQILATERTYNRDASKIFEDLKIPWIDLNFGCPSKHVNRHHGGAYLLDHPDKIKTITKEIRHGYNGFLSAKIRIGYQHANNFLHILDILEGEGVDLITVHPRTKIQMYLGKSDWQYIKIACEKIKIPIVGNGDIENFQDIDKMFYETNCQGIMIGRGAIKKPWLSDEYKNQKNVDETKEIKIFFDYLINELKHSGMDLKNMVTTIKQLTHYLLNEHNYIKNQILRCHNLNEIFTLIDLAAI